MNARATDYIIIADYQDGAAECFAALGSPAAPVVTTPVMTRPGTTTPGTTPEVGAIPDTLQALIDTFSATIDEVAPWIDESIDIAAYNWDQELTNPEDDSTERGLTRDVGGLPAPILQPVLPAPRVPRDPATLAAIWINAGGGATGTVAVLAYLVTSYGAEWVEAWIRKKLSKGGDETEATAQIVNALKQIALVDATIDFGTVRYHVKGQTIEY